MKTLLVSYCDTGGAGKACVRLHRGLLDQGVDSKLLVLVQNDPSVPESYLFYGNRMIRRKLRFGINKIVSRKSKISSLTKGYEGFSFPYSAHKLHLHPLVQWADVVNLHWVASFLDYPSFFRATSKPVAWTLHDMLPFSGGYHYRVGFPMDAYDCHIRENVTVKTRAVENANLTVVPLCEWMKSESESSKAFGDLTHQLIPNGINTDQFRGHDRELARSVFNIPHDKKVLLFAADVLENKRKGFDLLIRALQQLGDSESVVLAVVGRGIVEIDTLQSISLGYIADERLMALAYSAADLFVIPSVEDNLPNTVVGSICCGTPVVGFNIGGIPDMIQESINGCLANETNAESLCSVLKKALVTSFDRSAIRVAAVTKYHQSVQSNRYIDLFKSLTAKDGK